MSGPKVNVRTRIYAYVLRAQESVRTRGPKFQVGYFVGAMIGAVVLWIFG